MNLQEAFKPYPTKEFGVGDLQAAFMGLSEPAVITPVIDFSLQDAQAMVPVSALVNGKKRQNDPADHHPRLAVWPPLSHLIQMRRIY